MKKRESVQHIMATEPIVLQLNDGLSKAEKLFKTHHVRHLPVVSGETIVGIWHALVLWIVMTPIILR